MGRDAPTVSTGLCPNHPFHSGIASHCARLLSSLAYNTADSRRDPWSHQSGGIMSRIQDRVEQSPAMQRLAETMSAPAYRDDLPTLDRPGVVALCASMGVEVTERGVKFESIKGELASHKVLGRNRWSEVDVLAWLRGGRRVGTSHTSGDAA